MKIQKVSYYLSSYDTHGMEINIYRILDSIKCQKFEKEISKIRECEDKTLKNKLKSNLSSFIPSGVFVPTREMYNFTRLSGLMVLDIDQSIIVATGEYDDSGKEKRKKVKQYKDVAQILAAVNTDPYTFCSFISPSGNGLKILVRIGDVMHLMDDEVIKSGPVKEMSDIAVDVYYEAFNFMRERYKENYNIVLDRSGKNINRICYMSSDPNLFMNEDSLLIPVQVRQFQPKVFIQTPESHNQEEADMFFKMELAISFVDKHQSYGEGNRNNYIYELACTLNRFGVSMEETLELIKIWYSLPATDRGTEWYKTTRSAYVGNKRQHGIKKVLVSQPPRIIVDANGKKSLRK